MNVHIRQNLARIIAAGLFVEVWCEGERVDDGHRLCSDIDEIYQDTQAVDDFSLQIHDADEKPIGYIVGTNCNDADEWLVDYSCGPMSAQFTELLSY